MKQKVRVVGMIRDGDRFLVLKKNMGRIDESPTWGLPSGKIKIGEQPEESIARLIYEELGMNISKLKLKDVITFTEFIDSSKIYNLYIIYDIEFEKDNNKKIKLNEKYSAYKYLAYTEDFFAVLRFDGASASVLEIEFGRVRTEEGKHSGVEIGLRGAANGATIYTDGGSRGNPGPSGIGYVVFDENGKELKRGGEFIGFATSRVAEYFGLKEGCEQALELGIKTVRFISDNLMMVNQMNGIYQVKNNDILPIYNDINRLIQKFEAVAFIHVHREQNMIADGEVNKAIDRHFKMLGS